MHEKVRFAVEGEAEVVAGLAAETFPTACPPDMNPDDMYAYIETNLTRDKFDSYIAGGSSAVLLYEDEDRLIGYSLVFFDEAAQPDPSFNVDADKPAFLSKCYVLGDYYGTGVAKALLDSVGELAAERGCDRLWLNVNSVNYRAQRFYEKHGWERVGSVEFRVGSSIQHDPVYQLAV